MLCRRCQQAARPAGYALRTAAASLCDWVATSCCQHSVVLPAARVTQSSIPLSPCVPRSLGAALAMLAAIQLARELGIQNIECYTYGAPFPGNRAFCEEFNELIPQTHNVIVDGVRCFLLPAHAISAHWPACG